nr:MAG TPA: hypothetical protein [Caudoviricetes sp.]
MSSCTIASSTNTPNKYISTFGIRRLFPTNTF